MLVVKVAFKADNDIMLGFKSLRELCEVEGDRDTSDCDGNRETRSDDDGRRETSDDDGR